MNAVDHLAEVRAMRALAGTRPSDEVIAGMHTGAQRLESLTRQWLTFPPRPSTITDAENTVEGIRRALIELRAGGQPDAA